MVFTPADDATPKVAHRLGLACPAPAVGRRPVRRNGIIMVARQVLLDEVHKKAAEAGEASKGAQAEEGP